ncbi:glyoxalase [Paramicrobacterium chengjingii]|uniref:Glyoxalase n=1 Tax=Paramicrobacterium chengjingii TaxID=2769067 RepID=A0ABX6YG76_9MICO|nr:glyoxalase [Microbacterium chengjingii]QPZ37609.1 glyoxalase [Microbacterium chengjingii]
MNTTTAPNALTSITLEVPDIADAERFYAAFDLGSQLEFRQSAEHSEGFRGFTISLIVSQPANAGVLLDAAIDAGATVIKPAAKNLWGFGGTVKAPDGTIVKVATSKKKNTEPASSRIDDVVVLLAASNVPASKRFYSEQGFTPGKSFGSYVEFETRPGTIKLGLYKRSALAKDAGVPEEGSGAHRIAFGNERGAFTDPDGFTWI